MNGWSPLDGQTHFAYSASDPNDTEVGHMVFYF